MSRRCCGVAMQTPRGHNLGKVAEIRVERLDYLISLPLPFFFLGKFVFEAFEVFIEIRSNCYRILTICDQIAILLDISWAQIQILELRRSIDSSIFENSLEIITISLGLNFNPAIDFSSFLYISKFLV